MCACKHVHTCVEGRPCEGARRWPSASQEESPHQESNHLHLDLGLPSLQNCEKEMPVV